jgi:hypothetical protein
MIMEAQHSTVHKLLPRRYAQTVNCIEEMPVLISAGILAKVGKLVRVHTMKAVNSNSSPQH